MQYGKGAYCAFLGRGTTRGRYEMTSQQCLYDVLICLYSPQTVQEYEARVLYGEARAERKVN